MSYKDEKPSSKLWVARSNRAGITKDPAFFRCEDRVFCFIFYLLKSFCKGFHHL